MILPRASAGRQGPARPLGTRQTPCPAGSCQWPRRGLCPRAGRPWRQASVFFRVLLLLSRPLPGPEGESASSHRRTPAEEPSEEAAGREPGAGQGSPYSRTAQEPSVSSETQAGHRGTCVVVSACVFVWFSAYACACLWGCVFPISDLAARRSETWKPWVAQRAVASIRARQSVDGGCSVPPNRLQRLCWATRTF